MKVLFNISFVLAIIGFLAAIVTRILYWSPWGYPPGTFIKFANTALLFAIVFILRIYLPAKE